MTVTAIIPMLPVRNVSASLEFYRKLGFEVVNHNAQWGWAMLENGESKLMLDQSINASPAAPLTEFRIDDPDGNRLWIGQPAAKD